MTLKNLIETTTTYKASGLSTEAIKKVIADQYDFTANDMKDWVKRGKKYKKDGKIVREFTYFDKLFALVITNESDTEIEEIISDFSTLEVNFKNMLLFYKDNEFVKNYLKVALANDDRPYGDKLQSVFLRIGELLKYKKFDLLDELLDSGIFKDFIISKDMADNGILYDKMMANVIFRDLSLDASKNVMKYFIKKGITLDSMLIHATRRSNTIMMRDAINRVFSGSKRKEILELFA